MNQHLQLYRACYSMSLLFIGKSNTQYSSKCKFWSPTRVLTCSNISLDEITRIISNNDLQFITTIGFEFQPTLYLTLSEVFFWYLSCTFTHYIISGKCWTSHSNGSCLCQIFFNCHLFFDTFTQKYTSTDLTVCISYYRLMLLHILMKNGYLVHIVV